MILLCCSYYFDIHKIIARWNLFIQDGPQGKVNQDTRLDNRIIDLRVSSLDCLKILLQGGRLTMIIGICTCALCCVSSTDG